MIMIIVMINIGNPHFTSFYQLCKGDDSAPHAFHQAQFGIECYLYSYIYKYGK